MPRLTKKLFDDLAIWMAILGLIVGFLFPPFTVLLGFNPEQAYTFTFWGTCTIAGLLVASLNYTLANKIVRTRILLLADQMRMVEKAIHAATYSGDWSSCDPNKCHMIIDSEDELGESARTFNDLVYALFRSHEVETAISEFTKALSKQLNLDLLCKKALELMLHHTEAVAGMVITNSAGEQQITANYGIREPALMLNSDHIKKAIKYKTVLNIKIPEDVKIEAVMTDFRPTEVMVVPIDFKDDVLGVVVLATSRSFSSDAIWMIEFFRQGFGLALHNAVIHNQMQQMAALDALTGALDRRFGMTRLSEEYARAKRAETALSIMMLDLDHFKKVNDVYGHLIGDKVLIEAVKKTRRILRESDAIVRFGGEEFLVILPGEDAHAAKAVGERICTGIEEMTVRGDGQIIKVTVSIGLASYPENEVDQPDGLIRYADQALYHSKSAGRNQLTVFDPLCTHS